MTEQAGIETPANTFTDRDGAVFEAEAAGRVNGGDVIDLVENGSVVATFYKTDATRIIALIEEAASVDTDQLLHDVQETFGVPK